MFPGFVTTHCRSNSYHLLHALELILCASFPVAGPSSSLLKFCKNLSMILSPLHYSFPRSAMTKYHKLGGGGCIVGV